MRTIPAPIDNGLRDAQTGPTAGTTFVDETTFGPTPNEIDLELGLTYDEAVDVEAIKPHRLCPAAGRGTCVTSPGQRPYQ